MSLQGIHYWRQLVRNLAKRKLNSIIEPDLGIRGFGDAYGIRIMAKLGSVTHGVKRSKKLGDMRKDRITLGRLGRMVRPDSIRLDGLT